MASDAQRAAWRDSSRRYRQSQHGRATKVRIQTASNRRKRGWSQDAVDQCLALQGNACAICRRPFTQTPRADHDHATGKPRGLLCHKCNAGIGMLDDDLGIVERAAAYLRSFS